MPKLFTGYWRPIFCSLILFSLNVYICHELFGIEFLNNLSTNDGAFISIARFYEQHGLGHGWFPWFNVGMPIENAYQPLLPAMAAIVGNLSGWPIARAFHFVLAAFYCLGPVTLFWFAWEWSESLVIGLIAGLAYSLTSPAELLIPSLRVTSGVWGGLRLFNLTRYAEDPHNVALALLPLALLYLHRAIGRRNALNIVAAIVSCGAVVLANAFGAVDLAIGGLCIALAMNRGLTILLPAGIAAWFWISPMLPPSLIEVIRHDQWGARGRFNSGTSAWLSVLAAAVLFALLWAVARQLKSGLERFSIFFAFWMCGITVAFFMLNLTLVPQGSRYQLEMEMALCLCFGCLCAHVPWRTAVTVIILIAGVRQTVLLRKYAVSLTQPIDITGTVEYKVVRWLDRNLPGQRTMISGDPEYLYNIFSDNPQMAAGHEPMVPDWEQRVAVYTIYSGMNAGQHDAEDSILWLKAFGNQAIYVAGEKSREHYHAVVHPHKFDGLLPILWHDEDDTIFAVPQRSRSLAHVIPNEVVVAREPIHGLDVDPLRPFVAALDDPSLPVAEMIWTGTASAEIHAPMKPDQVISIQVTWAPGWRASVGGKRIPVRRDGIGLIVLEPNCDGACDIRLDFGPTTEAWICRALSAVVTLAMIGGLIRWRFDSVPAVKRK